MSWTQPVCIPCWNRTYPDRQAEGSGDASPLEHCCLCGGETRSGLYARLDPETVPFPSGED